MEDHQQSRSQDELESGEGYNLEKVDSELFKPLQMEGSTQYGRPNSNSEFKSKRPSIFSRLMLVVVVSLVISALIIYTRSNHDNQHSGIAPSDDNSKSKPSDIDGHDFISEDTDLDHDDGGEIEHESDDDDDDDDDGGGISETKDKVDDDNVEGDDEDEDQEEAVGKNNGKFSVQNFDGVMFETIGDVLYHDKTHFTQGLTYSRHSDLLFQSNGLYRKSSLCKLNATTGHSIYCKNMDAKYFAEGMQVYGSPGEEKLIQITWKSGEGFIYDAESLDTIKEFQYKTTKNEGWGICYDEENHMFIVSDGSAFLHFWDADTLEEKYRIAVTRMNGQQVKNLNELEFVNGKVLGNIWYSDIILVIDPKSGKCESEYDMSQLWPKQNRTKYRADVLNGISISRDDGVLYFTGKLWDRMFKVRLFGF